MESIGEIYASNVARLRKLKGWSQETLAERSELSKTTIANHETQVDEPSFKAAEKIAHALGVSTWRLFVPPELIIRPTAEEALSALAELHNMDPPKPRKKHRASRE